jgi:hypothetical protein
MKTQIIIDTNGNFRDAKDPARRFSDAQVKAIRALPQWKRHSDLFEAGLYEEESVEVDL